MSSKKTAALSPSLLVRKGHASPTGYGAGRKSTSFAPVLIAGSDIGKTAGAKPTRRRPRTVENDARQVRVSVRMGIAEHLRLKLASAHVQRTMSDLITTALENYIDRLAPKVEDGNCECITKYSENNGDNQAASEEPPPAKGLRTAKKS